MEKLRIGTLVNGDAAPIILPQIIPYGFESFSLTFWQTLKGVNLEELAKQVNAIVDEHDIKISCLSIFGNVMEPVGRDEEVPEAWKRVIDAAPLFNVDLVTGFTGRLTEKSIEENIPKFKEVYTELCKRAADKGVSIAFENCDMGGDWNKGGWNIAHNPTAWEMMFDAVPLDNIGLEWEPCHQMVSLIDPIPQLRKWVNKVFHVHGKDCTIAWDIVREYGIHGPKQFAWHRTPGFGDTNWTDIITILRQNDYKGSIDIEGFHDPVYRGELEMTGQVRGLNYLKECRGGDFYPNPI